MRILIVGGAGFVGSHLARHCVALGHEVHLLLRPSSDAARVADLQPGASLYRLSLSDGPALATCLAAIAPTHIFYMAVSTAGRHGTNVAQARGSVTGSVDFLSFVEVVAGLANPPLAFVRTGSIAEYGEAQVPFREVQREEAVTGYAAAIVAATHCAQAIARHLPFPLVTARLSLVYGTGQASDFLVPTLISSCLGGKPVTLNRPLDRRDLLHVDDVTAALMALAETPLAGGEIINIGSGETVSVAELADRIATLTGIDPASIQRKPQVLPVVHHLCIEKIGALVGWRPRIPLSQGLESLVSQMRGERVAVAA